MFVTGEVCYSVFYEGPSARALKRKSCRERRRTLSEENRRSPWQICFTCKHCVEPRSYTCASAGVCPQGTALSLVSVLSPAWPLVLFQQASVLQRAFISRTVSPGGRWAVRHLRGCCRTHPLVTHAHSFETIPVIVLIAVFLLVRSTVALVHVFTSFQRVRTVVSACVLCVLHTCREPCSFPRNVILDNPFNGAPFPLVRSSSAFEFSLFFSFWNLWTVCLIRFLVGWLYQRG